MLAGHVLRHVTTAMGRSQVPNIALYLLCLLVMCIDMCNECHEKVRILPCVCYKVLQSTQKLCNACAVLNLRKICTLCLSWLLNVAFFCALCTSGICGSCSMNIDGSNTLACIRLDQVFHGNLVSLAALLDGYHNFLKPCLHYPLHAQWFDSTESGESPKKFTICSTNSDEIMGLLLRFWWTFWERHAEVNFLPFGARLYLASFLSWWTSS